MKKTMLFGMTLCLATMLCCGCQQGKEGASRIHGTISSQYNDKLVYLKPLYGPETAGFADSAKVEDGKFEFATDTVMMARILVDERYRRGLDPLLVITEAGDIEVVIGQESHVKGTPLNDSLEKWKLATQAYNAEQAELRKANRHMEADIRQQEYKQLTRTMAENCEGSLLGEFLNNYFPKTYKRQYPDGREVTINADTNEEVSGTEN